MKKSLFLPFLLFTIIANAQYAKIFDFAGTSSGNSPYGDLLFDGTFLYGMTYLGGTSTDCSSYGCGVIFKIKPDGTGYVKLLDFNGTSNGRLPEGSLISDGTFLYGMTVNYNGWGNLFKIKPDGTGFATILNFDGVTHGSAPRGSLLYDGTFLYGTTSNGGTSTNCTTGCGVIFKIKPDGTGYSKLLDFDNTATGSNPNGNLLSDGTFLYGMARRGGANGLGTVFKIKTDGTGFTKLFDFAGVAGGNGNYPYGSLISDGTFLYGMTWGGGVGGGTIFKIKPDGTGFVNLSNFGGNNGELPYGSLISDGTFLYGMTYFGNNKGNIFKIKPDGTALSTLYYFGQDPDGNFPHGSLISDGTFLYGTTSRGGTGTCNSPNGGGGCGTIFKYCISPVVFTQSLAVCTGQSVIVGTHTYTAAGTYTETLISHQGCDSIVTTNLTVNPLPTVTANTSATNICAGTMATLTGGGAVSYTWSGGVSDGQEFVPTTSATYTVTGTDGNNCSNTATKTITVNPLPTVTANASATFVCDGTFVTLTGGGTTSYVWSGGVNDGLGFVPTNTTTYTVTGTDGNNCSNTATKTITVNPLPAVTANASATNVCEGNPVTLTGGGASSYTWSGGVSNGIGFIPATTTTYTVTGTDGNNCSNTATKTIHVNPLPAVTANASATIVCAGTSITLSGEGATSYTWSGGVTNGLSFVPSTSATYTVTGTDGNNCSNTATKTINVNPLPTVTAIATATDVCEGTVVTLTGGGAASYTWSGGITNGLAFVTSTTTTYTVTGTDGNNCSNTATKTITVTPLLDLTTSLSGLTISANQTGAIYQWLDCNNGNSAIAGETYQSYTASINGNYSVIVKMNSCSDTSTCVNVNITGIAKTAENNIQLKVFPNPGNGSITITLSGVEEQSINEGIYTVKNEAGQMIQTFKLNTSNNYTVNIENLSNGIYFIVGLNGNQIINQKVVIAK